MNIEFKKIPHILIQKWLLENAEHGYYSIIANRFSKKYTKEITRQTVVNVLRTINIKLSDTSRDILLEAVCFCREQGHIFPDYVDKYLQENISDL